MSADPPGVLQHMRPMIAKAVKLLIPEVRYRAENSIEGFERAKVLLPIDREMASFRAITAEEEAAAALFRSLQLRRYPGAQRLSLRHHHHKAATAFFLRAVVYDIVGEGSLDIRITLEADPPSVTIALPAKQFVALSSADEHLHIVLAEPLGVVSKKDDVADNDMFDAAVRKVAGDRKVDKLIAKAANSRNRILYAHDGGLPRSQVTPAAIEQRQRNADLFLILAIAVLQTESQQPMAAQCLQGFLKVIGRASPDVIT